VIPLAASNTAPVDIAFNNEIQLRIVLPEVLGASGLNVKFRLQFSEYSDFSSSSLVTEIPDCVLGISLWCYSDGGGTDNATTTTALLSESDTCDSGIGAGCGTHNESGTSSTTSEHVHQSGDSEEYAFTIIHAGARVNRVYYFRLLDASDNEPVLTVSEATYPSLITEGASLSFSMAGISSTTVIDGESIDIDSSPSLIHFGNLPFNTKLSAAHRLQIDTNGTEGYRILMYSRGDFESLTGSRIEPVSGTNALPLAWDTGCDGSAYSCFGYHTTDPTLEGGSARFSASDTFARLSSTTAEEIAYSTSPTEGETTDIVYKLQITPAAYSGQYETNIVYLAVPLF
jgi:hypothetical protein